METNESSSPSYEQVNRWMFKRDRNRLIGADNQPKWSAEYLDEEGENLLERRELRRERGESLVC
jgi:hypothetical protein